MVGPDREAELSFELNGERCEGVVGDLDHHGAPFADEVLMGIVAQVIDGAPVTEVDVIDDAESLECFQRAIDRRQVNVGVVPGHDGGHIFGGDM